ncbi:hypothetical protein EES39_35015 [Streptomyces sp. ADI92-24]|nr:hypothetical protein EES39_35015 [Streptomyces sp. ADI92-24]
MTSRAGFGPDSTATWSAERQATSAMTWLARSPEPTSMPFISDTITVSGPTHGAHAARPARRDCAAMDSTR